MFTKQARKPLVLLVFCFATEISKSVVDRIINYMI